jgi:hypothetical protein
MEPQQTTNVDEMMTMMEDHPAVALAVLAMLT